MGYPSAERNQDYNHYELWRWKHC